MRANSLVQSTYADVPMVRAVSVGAWRSPVSALVWGTMGRGFKPRRPDHRKNQLKIRAGFMREGVCRHIWQAVFGGPLPIFFILRRAQLQVSLPLATSLVIRATPQAGSARCGGTR